MQFEQSDFCAKIGTKRAREESQPSTESLDHVMSSLESDSVKRIKRGTQLGPDFILDVKIPLARAQVPKFDQEPA